MNEMQPKGLWTKLSYWLNIIACVYECSATLPPHSLISVHESKAFPCCPTLDTATMYDVTATNYGYAHT